MAEITDLSDLVNRATGGSNGTPETVFFQKNGRILGAASPSLTSGRYHSLWTYDGQPSGGAVPTTAIIPDNTTAGALKQANPGGTRQKWLYQFGGVAGTAGTFILYDRLFQIGGLSGTSTAEQTVQGSPASPALTRYETNSTCVGNQILIEIHTAIGGTATTVTASYTNQAGTSGQTTVAQNIGGSGMPVSRSVMLPLASGDTGVQAVKSITLAATTGTTGNLAVAIIRPLAFFSLPVGGCAGFRDFTVGLPSIPEIKPNAALALLFVPTFTSMTDLLGAASMVEA